MIKVRFFAMLKNKTGKEEVNLSVPDNITLEKLKAILKNEFPAIAEFIERKSIMISVNQEFATNTTIIKDGDEVALLPPFSGG
ncbi:MAG: molybdopterin converting factor subunit 1 [Deltaproteobacteria bacterium RIFCSPLOWO2_12_FULL_43_16]|nr:MAG: molybdopterin converting factor subunit 1 [Deltaproteobacteria bacterium GWA2_43_19]OGQ10079.1 MAG: molybdopterin converting factor subunit 1 [Deltaproteobacteria bacterium RIFCSPHIGHO2_02_FULL_43_33]OGQ40160.1 MAG: molybdopterin converting factor subunit 1 [Deltaproteobacteria bacterium RIFCSPLOWO2_01_FULL_42_9]OGQ59062.1 MAG: molybdopterin converting factor subunit 1 [Deltaproteobacteria bacterium RIFCSPLOWO2_12_FULL_43_16]HBR18449.1 molybdopterin converting factor subunit 1 [Deltapro